MRLARRALLPRYPLCKPRGRFLLPVNIHECCLSVELNSSDSCFQNIFWKKQFIPMLFLQRSASCRPCRSCTRTYLRTTTSWSWCKETLSSCPRWSRAALVKAGYTVLHSARGYRACCRRITSPAPMSRTRGSFMGEDWKWQDVTQFCWNVFFPGRATAVPCFACFFSCLLFKAAGLGAVFCNCSFVVCVNIRSHSVLNCASPSNSGGVASGLLFDGKLNDSLLDSLMDPSAHTGLCPPMQVQLSCHF